MEHTAWPACTPLTELKPACGYAEPCATKRKQRKIRDLFCARFDVRREEIRIRLRVPFLASSLGIQRRRIGQTGF